MDAEKLCDKLLPSKYDEIIFKEKCDDLYMHFYENYQSANNNVYIKDTLQLKSGYIFIIFDEMVTYPMLKDALSDFYK